MQTETQHEGPGAILPVAQAQPHLFLVLECDRPLAGAARYALQHVDAVLVGRGPERGAQCNPDNPRELRVLVPGTFVSSRHARLERTPGGWRVEDAGSRNGTFVNGNRVTSHILVDGDLVEVGRTFFLFRAALAGAGPAVLDERGLQEPIPGLRSMLPSLEEGLKVLCTVACSTLPILLLGESGTGKEVLAKAIHGASGRKGAFVPVNCGALPDTLVESQLFGHVKGSFTGANRDEPGFIRASDGGTLFLDEIGDLPRAAQATLLRVLQEHEVTPVGATKAVKVDLRVVAATHRRLDLLAARGDFRHDLYARLGGCIQYLAPLRDRPEDLGLLAAALLKKVAGARAGALRLSVDAGRVLVRHSWPLNIRELEQGLSLASVLATDGVIQVGHLPASITSPPVSPPPAPVLPTAADEASAPDTGPLGPEDEAIKARLISLLAEHHGNISQVARAMGKARMQIHRWMKRFGIDPAHPVL